jgi:hypothetical protein
MTLLKEKGVFTWIIWRRLRRARVKENGLRSSIVMTLSFGPSNFTWKRALPSSLLGKEPGVKRIPIGVGCGRTVKGEKRVYGAGLSSRGPVGGCRPGASEDLFLKTKGFPVSRN